MNNWLFVSAPQECKYTIEKKFKKKKKFGNNICPLIFLHKELFLENVAVDYKLCAVV